MQTFVSIEILGGRWKLRFLSWGDQTKIIQLSKPSKYGLVQLSLYDSKDANISFLLFDNIKPEKFDPTYFGNRTNIVNNSIYQCTMDRCFTWVTLTSWFPHAKNYNCQNNALRPARRWRWNLITFPPQEPSFEGEGNFKSGKFQFTKSLFSGNKDVMLISYIDKKCYVAYHHAQGCAC